MIQYSESSLSVVIELPKPKNAPGSLSDSVFVTAKDVHLILAGIAARHKIRDERFKDFAKKLEQRQEAS